MRRRRFLALVGTAIPGLWLAGAGLIQLPGRMVLAISGRCSFCGRNAAEVYGVAGVVGRGVRICNECVEICLEILRDDQLAGGMQAGERPTSVVEDEIGQDFIVSEGRANDQAQPAIGEAEPSASVLAGDGDELAELLRQGGKQRSGGELEALVEEVGRLLGQVQVEQKKRRRTPAELACSFCERKQHEAARLIAGPDVFICDVCTGDAAALFTIRR